MMLVARALLPVAAVLSLSSCETISYLTQGITDQVLLGPLPSTADPIQYSNDDQFDLKLYRLAREGDEDIHVNFGPPVTELPERVQYWTSRVDDTGGSVLTCDVNEASNLIGLSTLVNLLGGARIIDQIKSELRKMQLYSPAADWNAVIEAHSAEENLRGVRFVSRNTDLATVRADYSECRNL
ncbi:hypothetical protein HFP57_14920 [Parasphingopyxis algicola]|uniref:hypothetical protein n=1 Tax=Parasphingopyxis algicola TaxID=2026624 RepID=UPI0015A0B75A|nr:hypothetical protein [Parasphingopyxis algicola]QLC26191.1 hypothetical protein HFP57_14920 [Parasphingopyxis algicola]